MRRSVGGQPCTLELGCVCVWQSSLSYGTCRPGSYSGARLLPGKVLLSIVPDLHRDLAEKLLADPPYELRWLRSFPDKVGDMC